MVAAVPSEFQDFIKRGIASGRFRTADEVVAEGLRLLQQREHKLERLRTELLAGADELDRGEGVPADLVLRELREQIEELERQAP